MKKTFDLDKGIFVPEKISSVQRKEGILYIAKNNPSFMLLEDIESRLFEELMKGKSIRESASFIYDSQKTYSTKQIESNVKTLLEKIEQSNFYHGVSNPQKKNWPLHLYLTNDCNLRCKTCYKNAGNAKENELSTAEILKLIDDFSIQGPNSVVLSGGEPLKKPDFFKILEYIKKHEHKISVVSNGLLIESKDDAKRITELTDMFQISLDGATEEFNDFYRGKGTYKQILQKIDLFKDLEFTLNIGMVVSEYNFHDINNNLKPLLDTLQNKRLKLNMSNLMEYGRGKYCLNKGTQDLVHKIMEKARESGIPSKKWEILTIRAYDCGFARSVTVDSDGEIHYCPVANEHTKTGLNIRKMPFTEVLQHFKEMNKSMSVEYMKGCDKCDLEYLCGGGCRIVNKEKEETILHTKIVTNQEKN